MPPCHCRIAPSRFVHRPPIPARRSPGRSLQDGRLRRCRSRSPDSRRSAAPPHRMADWKREPVGEKPSSSCPVQDWDKHTWRSPGDPACRPCSCCIEMRPCTHLPLRLPCVPSTHYGMLTQNACRYRRRRRVLAWRNASDDLSPIFLPCAVKATSEAAQSPVCHCARAQAAPARVVPRAIQRATWRAFATQCRDTEGTNGLGMNMGSFLLVFGGAIYGSTGIGACVATAGSKPLYVLNGITR